MKRILILAGVMAASIAVTNAQVQRMVLAEAFSNASCGPCASQNPAYNALLASNTTKVIGLKYQWYFPGYDPMHNHNPTEVNTRFGTYYGQSGVPWGALDGTEYAGPNYPGALANLDQTEIDARYGTTSPFAITINPTLSADKDSVLVSVDVNTPGAFTGSTLKLHVLLIEKHITFSSAPGSNGETQFHDVMLDMIPGVNGFDIQASWTASETETYTFGAPLPLYVYDHQELAIVAFIQNNATKEVHQAAQSDLVVSDFAVTENITGAGTLNCSSTINGLTVDLTNDGNTTVTSATVNYSVDGGTALTIPYSGSLAVGATTTVNIPTLSGLSSGNHDIETWITNVNTTNSAARGYADKTFNTFSGIGSASPLSQAFTASGFPYTNWTLDNPNPSISWARVTTNAGSMKFDCYNYGAGSVSSFIVEPTNITTLTTPTLTFDVAHRQYSASYSEDLEVFVSTNCGTSWVSIYNTSGAALATVSGYTGNAAFTPTTTQWRTETVNLTPYIASDNLFIKFTGTSGYGNNVYVDKINIANASTSINENTTSTFKVYPNPTTDFINVNFENAENITVSLINAMGQTVKVFNNVNNNTQLSLEGLATGVYVLNADINGARVTKQIIKN